MDRIIKKKTITLKRVLIPLGIVLCIAAAAYSYFYGDRSSWLTVDSKSIVISTVVKDFFQEFVPVIGNIVPVKTVYIDAIEGGSVEEKYVEPGAFVSKGDMILKLSNTNLALNVMLREAELSDHSNDLRNTRLSMEQYRLDLESNICEIDYQLKTQEKLYNRTRALVKENIISVQEYENVKDKYEYLKKRKALAVETFRQNMQFRKTQIIQLEDSLKRMEANLRITEKKMENLTIRAPISGQLTALDVEIGQSKAPGQRLGQIDVLDGLKVEADVDEHYINRIETGTTGFVEIAGKNYGLVVNKIYPEVLDGKFKVSMNFSGETPEGIRTGQTMHIRFQLGNLTKAVLLPRGGFFNQTGGRWCFIVDKTGKFAVKRNIQLGRQNIEMFEVLNGLKPGEKVITTSYDNFKDFDKMVLKNAREAAYDKN
jgi:HlyD family secretion protein